MKPRRWTLLGIYGVIALAAMWLTWGLAMQQP